MELEGIFCLSPRTAVSQRRNVRFQSSTTQDALHSTRYEG